MKLGMCRVVLACSLVVGGVAMPGAADASPPAAAVAHESLPGSLPLILAQDSEESSSRRTRIPRGLIRMGIAGVLLAAGAVGWVIRKATGAE